MINVSWLFLCVEEHFEPRVDSILNRDEIAGCIEKAYTTIALGEAARMLFFESQKPMQDYAEKVSIFLFLEGGVGWLSSLYQGFL